MGLYSAELAVVVVCEWNSLLSLALSPLSIVAKKCIVCRTCIIVIGGMLT